jgi:hypothetical protein
MIFYLRSLFSMLHYCQLFIQSMWNTGILTQCSTIINPFNICFIICFLIFFLFEHILHLLISRINIISMSLFLKEHKIQKSLKIA